MNMSGHAAIEAKIGVKLCHDCDHRPRQAPKTRVTPGPLPINFSAGRRAIEDRMNAELWEF